ncbi:DUF501 domain-containing protein [Rhodoluna sp.]|uniref:DUF501 domain-containing protein n=1 Tax=Rhodoluna sp. TaxID=1969481 RepID=UPI0025FF9729|nr:DUF501 domain-containing protein [Rhodoluna sp.]
MPLTPVTEADIAEVSRQLGRPARDIVAIAARCVCGKPTVVHTAPRLSDGTPFPTTYYLTHRGATAAVSTLEASGLMAELQARLGEEPELAEAYQKAHESFIADRDRTAKKLGLDVPEISGISAGGMPTRVKCLHALIGHALAAGPGVNPIGDIALEACSWSPYKCVCESY